MKNQSRENPLNPQKDYSKKNNIHQKSSLFFLIGLLYVVFIVNLSKRIIYNTPELRDPEIPFIGDDAWKDLKILNDLGPKVSGTIENEILAVNIIKKRIEQILSRAHSEQALFFDHQIVSGSYFLDFKPGMAAIYRSVQNLIVKVEGNTENALLLNCHFDSVYGSFGASDDIANCAIMLEILSILSQREIKLRHTVIFLFNGAEEVSLRASHGFITQHKWAKDVKVVINLEAAGSGGKEILFQSGPSNAWLLNHYHAVRNPFAQVTSEEIFQSGLIPSDTDFRIFRDFGNVVGLDLAYNAKGYRYHTKYDHIDFISKGCIQRTGENVLALVNSIANGNEMDNPDNFKSDQTSAVYFDYLGFVFVHYTKEVGAIINFLITIFAITTPFLTLTKTTINVHSKHILSESLLGLFIMIVSVGSSLFVSYMTGILIDKMGHSMFWYHNTFLSQGVYSSITVLMSMLSYDVIDNTFSKKHSPISLGLNVQARIIGVNIFWGILTLGLTIIGLRSAYLFMMILFFSFISTLSIFVLGFHNSVNSWLYLYVIGQFLTILWTSYFHNVVIDFFIPIMGRSGSAKNPELFISVVCCVTTFFIISYLIPLTQLLKGKAFRYLTIIAILLVSVYLSNFTSMGFPYKDDSTGNPTPQRHHVVHTLRTFYDSNGKVRHSDGGITFIEWDRNALKTIEGVSMPYEAVNINEMCNNEVLCGLPIVQSRMIMLGLRWLPFQKPNEVHENAKIDSHSKINLGNNLVKFVFYVNSTSLTSFYIRPKDDAELMAWSLSKDFEDLSNKTYFASVAKGLEKEIKPFKFDVTLKVSQKNDGPLLDVTLVTVHSNRQEDFTDDFKKLVGRFPAWAFPVPLISSVNAYTF